MNRLFQILILYSIANPATIARSETTAFVRTLKPAVSNRNQLQKSRTYCGLTIHKCDLSLYSK